VLDVQSLTVSYATRRGRVSALRDVGFAIAADNRLRSSANRARGRAPYR
jgi:ABC-type dipeptide/oligopeptide/nickel transport system ATPase component